MQLKIRNLKGYIIKIFIKTKNTTVWEKKNQEIIIHSIYFEIILLFKIWEYYKVKNRYK